MLQLLRTTGSSFRTPVCRQQVTVKRRNILLFNKIPLDFYEAPVTTSISQAHKNRTETCVLVSNLMLWILIIFKGSHALSPRSELTRVWNQRWQLLIKEDTPAAMCFTNKVQILSRSLIQLMETYMCLLKESHWTRTVGVCLEACLYQGRWSVLISTNPAVIPVTHLEQGPALYGALAAKNT